MKYYKLFFILFVLDITAGIVVGWKLHFIAGIITALVLLAINAISFLVILKMEKKSNEKR
ncbi:MAG: hypothetical protein LBQ37_01545 [Elusimicrobiota bacterium]|jgi:hypothetical protein|nr:hypothetical protein [Elusimicrobiota bacterium]